MGEDIVRVEQGARTVELEKVATTLGERLEVRAPDVGDVIRLDAVALESVSWQDPRTLGGGGPADPRNPESLGDLESAELASTVRNEYALARIYRLDEGHLRITAPKLGYGVTVGVPELEWIATRDHDTFTDFLDTPFGPED